ncbi:MAG: GumC family protein [bacterium]
MQDNDTLKKLLFIIFKYKYRIIILFITILIVVSISIKKQPIIYETRCKFLVKVGREDSTPPTLIERSNLLLSKTSEDVKSEVEIFNSRYLKEKAIEKLGSDFSGAQGELNEHQKENLIREIETNLKVNVVWRSNVIQATYKDKDPHIAFNILDTLLEFYLEHHLKIHKTHGTLDFFSIQAKSLADRIVERENNLIQFKQEYNISDIATQKQYLLGQLFDYKKDLADSHIKINEQEVNIEELEQQLVGEPETVFASETFTRNPVIDKLNVKLVDLMLEEAKMLRKYQEDSRQMEDIRSEIEKVRAELSKVEPEVPATMVTGINIVFQELWKTYNYTTRQLDMEKIKAQELEEEIISLEKKVAELNAHEIQFDALLRQLNLDTQNYNLYIKKMEQIRIDEAMDKAQFSNISIIEPPFIPIYPMRSNKSLKLFLGIILSLITSCGIAFLSYYFDHAFNTEDEIESYLNINILGSISEINNES